MSQPPTWDHYASFLAVLRGGSLSAAARTIGTAQPTVRRHVEALEAALGTRLFTRSPAGLLPTEAALAMRPHAEAMAATAEALLRAGSATAGAVAGTVRVTASEVMAVEVLPPILAGLLAGWPDLVVELVASNRSDDLLRGEADIAVRMVRPVQGSLRARRVADAEVGLFAHPAYLARHPAPAGLVDLDRHAVIGDDRDRFIAGALAARALAVPRFRLRCDSQVAQLAAIRAGAGIGICQVRLAAGLERVLPAVAVPLPTWLVVHADLADVARVRTVFDALGAALA